MNYTFKVYNKMYNFIESNTNKYTQKLTNTLKQEFDEFLNKIPNIVLGDITHIIHDQSETTINKIENTDTKIKLDNGEFIIYKTGSYILTNMSNIYDNSKASNIYNIELDPILINLIQKINPLMPIKYINEFVLLVIELNINNFYKFISNVDLENKYIRSIDVIEEQNNKIEELENQIQKLTEKLYDSIPDNWRCVICMGYNDNSNVAVPCGHTVICDDCCNKYKSNISICQLCYTNINCIIKKK